MHPHLKIASALSGLLHGVLLTWTAGVVGNTSPPAAPGVQITATLLSSSSAPQRGGETPEISTRVFVLPESALVGERQFHFELPQRRQEPVLVTSSGELPPPVSVLAEAARSLDLAPALARAKEPISRRSASASVPTLASRALELAVGTSAEQLPEPLSNPAPRYPTQARLNGWEGTVLLELYITAEGDVGTLQVVRSSGHAILDAEAQRTVLKWRFRPAQRDSQSVGMTVRLPIHFRLQ